MVIGCSGTLRHWSPHPEFSRPANFPVPFLSTYPAISHLFGEQGTIGESVKSLAKLKAYHTHSAVPLTSSEKAMGSGRHDLPPVNPCELLPGALLSLMSLEKASKSFFSGTEWRLTSQLL